jgi:hypothetical protein
MLNFGKASEKDVNSAVLGNFHPLSRSGVASNNRCDFTSAASYQGLIIQCGVKNSFLNSQA